MKKKIVVIMMCGWVALLSGCSYLQKARRTDELERENARLKRKIEQLNTEKTKEQEQIIRGKDSELSELEKAKIELERALKNEIGEYKAKLQMTERGLVITFLAEILFDSGKSTIRLNGKETLQKVAEVLNNRAVHSFLAIEGHTDNEPIKYSGWASNWELSSARALAVVHYLIDECKVQPQRLSANAYGEYKAVVSNETSAGRQKNRRVEIVVMPSNISKVKEKVMQ